MRPGDLALVYVTRERAKLEGMVTLERCLSPDLHGDGWERWSVRFGDGDVRNRSVHAADILDRSDLEGSLAARGLA